MGDYVLALDGGGTKTRVACADRDGKVSLLPLHAGVNPMDNANWRAELELSLSEPRVTDEDIAFAVLGLPGYGEIDTLTTAQEETVRELCAFPYDIMNDVELAFEGAFLGAPGILILSGTGSMAIGKNSQETWVEVGGWGEGFGDEGSAYWIGREAITRVSWILDGRLQSPDFAEAILAAIGVDTAPNPFKLMDWYYNLKHPRSEIAALTPVVDHLARAGNSTASDILAMAADHLSRHIDTARRQLGAEETLAWSYAGSVFNSGILKAAVTERQGNAPAPPELSPLGGGLWAAARQTDWTVNADWTKRIAEGMLMNGS
jgi:N-acetylglucosamine kinase-like BadF-type ATPase